MTARGVDDVLAETAALKEAPRPEFMLQHHMIPLHARDGGLVVATWGAEESDVLDELRLLYGCDLRLVPIDEAQGSQAVHRFYGGGERPGEAVGIQEAPVLEEESALDDLVAQANEAPIIRLVNRMLLEAVERRGSDVHFEHGSRGLEIRYRIDGVLRPVALHPPQLAPAIVSRVKIMAGLDIAERRLPQDGRIRIRVGDRALDLRVGTLPGLHGESVVVRLLDPVRGRISLTDLGMSEALRDQFVRACARRSGIVLVTGPTGSGKTTTLYAALERVRTGEEKIITVEDPVEYELPGVVQVSIQPRIGLTFAASLRAMLRQDPDILLVGEIRDQETAEVATHAALTGHLVLSTLHTNDAVGALTRLVDLGVPPFLVASSVEAVLAQRLVRTLCPACAGTRPATAEESQLLGRDLGSPLVGAAVGCARCDDSGYRGRSGIYELLIMSEGVRRDLLALKDAPRLLATARSTGMRTLMMDAGRLVAEGRTSPEEVFRVLSVEQLASLP